MKITTYAPEVEARMRNFYHSLSEKDRRRYATAEAAKLGQGGITYLCQVLHCDEGTVSRGLKELKMPLLEKEKRIRQAGGGRKSVLETMEGLDEAFLEMLKNHTAGSPMDESAKWSNLSRSDMAERLKQCGFSVSVTVVDQLLDKHNFCRRQAFKVEAGKKNLPHRDKQFKNIERLKEEYRVQGNPVMGMDVKKRIDRQCLSPRKALTH